MVQCGSCGAEGHFEVTGGVVSVVFPRQDCRSPSSPWEEKEAHSLEIFQTAARDAAEGVRITAAAEPYLAWDRLTRPR